MTIDQTDGRSDLLAATREIIERTAVIALAVAAVAGLWFGFHLYSRLH